MTFPITRMRRLRGTKRIRNLVSETHIHIDQLVLPLFFDEGISSERVTDSMPGVATHPLSDYESLVNRIEESGLGSSSFSAYPVIRIPWEQRRMLRMGFLKRLYPD